MKEKIKNRNKRNIVVVTKVNKNQIGLAIIVHGLGGYKEQAFLENSASCLYSLGYTTIQYDSTNTFGESDGEYEEATVTQYLHDLEDILNWSMEKDWFETPLLVGHSLGGLISSLYANENKIKALITLNPAIFSKKGKRKDEGVKDPRTGETHFLKKSFITDYVKYDFIETIRSLSVPILTVVSDKDYNRNKESFDTMQITIIEDTGHNFKGKEEEVGESVCSWVKSNVIK